MKLTMVFTGVMIIQRHFSLRLTNEEKRSINMIWMAHISIAFVQLLRLPGVPEYINPVLPKFAEENGDLPEVIFGNTCNFRS